MIKQLVQLVHIEHLIFTNFGPLEISDSGEYVSIYYDDDHVDCAYLSTTIEKINVAHKYKNTTVKPTCTEGGYTHHKCSVCGDEYTDAKTEKLGHQYEKTSRETNVYRRWIYKIQMQCMWR